MIFNFTQGGKGPQVEGIGTLKKSETDAVGDGSDNLGERHLSLVYSILGSEVSVDKKNGLLVPKPGRPGEDERALELLFFWLKLPLQQQEIMLDVIRGLYAVRPSRLCRPSPEP
jgi:hypothetical protein